MHHGKLLYRSACFVIFLLLPIMAVAQSNKYAVMFADKENSPYSLTAPSDFLSDRALERRQKQSIALSQNDLPVTPAYIDSIRQTGVELLYTSRWMNLAVIATDDSVKIDSISDLEMVKEVQLLYDASVNKRSLTADKLESASHFPDSLEYGLTSLQLEMLNGPYLHRMQKRGEGVMIAVFDAGFSNVNSVAAFSHLYNDGRVAGVYDFVEGHEGVYVGNGHGTNVLSVMAAYDDSSFASSAPGATYWLFRTEDAASESRLEEMNWLKAAEYADSAGVDVINSSLGYWDFDLDQQDYSFSDMDGNTSIITRAADIAASKGMLVVNSAGNTGDKQWRRLIAPADADSILTVGGVDYRENYVAFSAKGPSYDRRVKPDVVALASGTVFIGNNGNSYYGTGTSYSSPLVAGLAACLWQCFPEKTNMEIIDAIRKSAGHYYYPDSLTGYGIPDFMLAYLYLDGMKISRPHADEVMNISPNPFVREFNMIYYSASDQEVNVYLLDMTGKILQKETFRFLKNSVNNIRYAAMDQLVDPGTYILKIVGEEEVISKKVIRR